MSVVGFRNESFATIHDDFPTLKSSSRATIRNDGISHFGASHFLLEAVFAKAVFSSAGTSRWSAECTDGVGADRAWSSAKVSHVATCDLSPKRRWFPPNQQVRGVQGWHHSRNHAFLRRQLWRFPCRKWPSWRKRSRCWSHGRPSFRGRCRPS